MDHPRLDLERYVPGLLTFVSNKMSRGASRTYRELFGVGVTEWRVISLLALEPGIPHSRVSEVIGLDKALVSRVVQALLDQRYVTVKPDPNDKRSTLVTLTAAGLRLHDRIIPVALEREKLLLSTLSVADTDALIRFLHQLLASVADVNAFRPALEGKPKRKKTERRRR